MTSLCVCSLVLVAAFLGHTCAEFVTTNGIGGEQCGDRVCLKGKADCDPGTAGNPPKCKCHYPPYTYGDGELNCYKKTDFRTEVTNDPRILTFNNNSIDLPLPCRYRLTHVFTEYKDRDKNVVGSCEFMVHAFHLKDKGKFYVGGYDVAIRIECNNGSQFEMSIRKYGKSANGQFDFYVNATKGSFSDNGPWLDDDITYWDPKTNLRLKCKVDQNNNLIQLFVKKCGMRIRFRPYDCKLRRQQTQVPGMAVAINCAYRPEFESVNKVLALPPKRVHNGFDIDSIQIPKLGRVGTMVARAIISDIEQNQPPFGNPACSDAKYAILSCVTLEDLQDAFKGCMWILTSPRFIHCYDPTHSGYYIMDLFNKCVHSFCSGLDPCVVVNSIKNAPSSKYCASIPGYPRLASFIGNNTCP